MCIRDRNTDNNGKKKKHPCTTNDLVFVNKHNFTNNVNILLPDLRDDLLQEYDEDINKQILKCPEVLIKFNNGITVSALIDTGSVINGLSEEWFNVNKKDIEPYEILPMTNSLIISAVGNKSKLIRKQILCDIEIDGLKNECVFLVIPVLINGFEVFTLCTHEIHQ